MYYNLYMQVNLHIFFLYPYYCLMRAAFYLLKYIRM
nr:MAG TPA: hypothetical protein [Crassvirales sp.]